jgi:sulfate transport system ATP-binding protein
LAHAQVTLLGYGAADGGASTPEARLQEAREQLGSGLAALETRESPEPPAQAVAEEVRRRPCDLAVLAFPAEASADGLALAEEVLRAGQHHLLLVPSGAQPGAQSSRVPVRALVCVAVGEPGKEDVAFSGRLLRHLRAEATILTVNPGAEPGAVARAERFLEGNRRAMARLGVPVTTRIRYGEVQGEIRAQIAEGQHDLLVLGVPLPRRGGAISLGGFVERLIPGLAELPVLIIRSPEAVS